MALRTYRVFFRTVRGYIELVAASQHEAEATAFHRLPAYQRNRKPQIEYTSVQCDGQPLPGSGATSCRRFTIDESGRCQSHRPQEGHAA
jgi:hypothetical protein